MSYGMFIKAEDMVWWNFRHAGLTKNGLMKFLKQKKRYAARLRRRKQLSQEEFEQ